MRRAELVFSSAYVRGEIPRRRGLDGGNEAILPQGNYQNMRFDPQARGASARNWG